MAPSLQPASAPEGRDEAPETRVPGRPRRSTIRDVASRAGVSKSLAALVFQGSSSVSEERRDRVLRAARELGYNVNWAARSLKARPASSTLLGMVVRDLHQPGVSSLVDGARSVFDASGFRVLIGVLSDNDSAPALDLTPLEVLRDLGASGILAAGSIPEPRTLTAMAVGQGVVCAGWAPPFPGLDVVRSDDELGMRLAVNHLADLGHRRIGYLGGHAGVVTSSRQAGYDQSMRERGLAAYRVVRQSDFSVAAGYANALSLLSAPKGARPTALACINDLVALGAMRAADELRVTVSITGYDDIEISALPRIGLTTVDPRNAVIGARAGRVLLDRLAYRDEPATEQTITPRLIVRGSTGSPGPGT